jgi:hypothetical protein
MVGYNKLRTLVRRYRTGFPPAGFQRKVSKLFPFLSQAWLGAISNTRGTAEVYESDRKSTVFSEWAVQSISLSSASDTSTDAHNSTCRLRHRFSTRRGESSEHDFGIRFLCNQVHMAVAVRCVRATLMKRVDSQIIAFVDGQAGEALGRLLARNVEVIPVIDRRPDRSKIPQRNVRG